MKHNRIVVAVTVRDDPNPRFLLQYATRYLWSCFGIFGVSSIEDLSCPMSIIVAALRSFSALELAVSSVTCTHSLLLLLLLRWLLDKL